MEVHHSFLNLSKGVHTIFRVSILVTASKEMMLPPRWCGSEDTEQGRPGKEVAAARGEGKCLGEENVLLVLSGKAPLILLWGLRGGEFSWDKFYDLSSSCSNWKYTLCTRAESPIHDSLKWTYFKRKLPVFILLNLRGKVHVNFSSLKHWKRLCFLNIYHKQICNYFFGYSTCSVSIQIPQWWLVGLKTS